jgi:hypothetical protein
MHALILSLALAAVSPASEDAQIASAEAALTGKGIKQNALVLVGSRVQREKGALVLVLDDGKSLRLGEGCKPTEEEPCPSYTLAAFLPSHSVFVVEKNEVESYDFLLIEMANGKQHTIDGPPHFSPDGKRFLTCRVDEMNGGGATIWRVAPGRYMQEWKDDRMAVCGPWKDNDSVSLGVYDAEPSGKPRAMTLSHKGDTWQLR